jgi:CRP/FNR family transcriptional regulator
MNDFSLVPLPIKNQINSICYFEGVTEGEVSHISHNSISLLHTYTANERIFLEGEAAQGLWIVESGRAKIYKLSPDGNEHILHLRGPGKTFNDIGALDGG